MKLQFTKMQGAGNDFVVLDETRGLLHLKPEQYRFLADRHFGVGADQILSVRASPSEAFDFEYAIHNADGGEVEHCGNGARCFVRYVRSKGLTSKRSIRVKTVNNALTLQEAEDGRITVDMGAPRFEHADLPFEARFAAEKAQNSWSIWQLSPEEYAGAAPEIVASDFPLAVLSMGNPHAVVLVAEVETAPVHAFGAWVQKQGAFPRSVNVGFMQILNRSEVKLRVYERGSGETLACGTGACAAVVAGIRLGHLDKCVDVQTRGGLLTIEWDATQGGLQSSVQLTGPAQEVFSGEIEIPD